MAKKIIENISGQGCQKKLFNSGAPMGRHTVVKAIQSSIFNAGNLKAMQEIHEVKIPDHINDIEKWVRSLYEPKVFSDWDELKDELALPDISLLIVPAGMGPLRDTISRSEIFRSAVILSKCSATRYTPNSPMIFTRSRLERKVELIKINIENYYELD